MNLDKQDMLAVQRLVKQFPVIKAFMLHRMGNLMQRVQGYINLMEMPEKTAAQKEKYIANALLECGNVMKFLRECVEEPPINFTDDSGE